MTKKRKVYIGLVVLITLYIFLTGFKENVRGQVGTSGVAFPIQLSNDVNVNGILICSSEGGFKACNSDYDPSLYGVVTTEPSVALEIEGDEAEGTGLVITTGVAKVRVSSINGNISEGDLLTTSKELGVAQKADRNGYVVGNALEEYSSENSQEVGLILVAINIHPAAGLSGAQSDLLAVLRQGVRAPIFDPLDSLRYFLAALIVLLSFGLGFVYFGRVGKTGVEAIGRNPLASKMIQLSVIIHVVVTIVIIFVGLFLAYLILIL